MTTVRTGASRRASPQATRRISVCWATDAPLLVTGYRLKPYGVRGVSGDLKGTFDWQDHFVLVNDAVNTDCGYPSSVVLKDR